MALAAPRGEPTAKNQHILHLAPKDHLVRLTHILSRLIISIEINLVELILNRFKVMTKSSDAQHYDLRILRALRQITRSIALHSRQLAACSNITAPQLICLRVAIDRGPLTATAISREIHVSPSTVVGILDRLEDKGLISRERGREDRRIVFISATAAGIELARDTPSPLQKKLADALNALPELEQATITLSLERVVTLMQSDGAESAEALGEPASPLLDVPTDGALPESGLVV